MSVNSRRKFLANIVAALTATTVSPLFVTNTNATENTPVTHEVAIERFKFVPSQLDVKSGDIIKWTNKDIAPHTATADDNSWGTMKLIKGESESLIVTENMSGEYFCNFHPHMKANLTITQ